MGKNRPEGWGGGRFTPLCAGKRPDLRPIASLAAALTLWRARQTFSRAQRSAGSASGSLAGGAGQLPEEKPCLTFQRVTAASNRPFQRRRDPLARPEGHWPEEKAFKADPRYTSGVSTPILREGRVPDEYDVFLSHNSRDKPAVKEIADRLRFPWQEGLEEGVKASRSVAVFVGANELGAWQRPEVQAFLERAM